MVKTGRRYKIILKVLEQLKGSIFFSNKIYLLAIQRLPLTQSEMMVFTHNLILWHFANRESYNGDQLLFNKCLAHEKWARGGILFRTTKIIVFRLVYDLIVLSGSVESDSIHQFNESVRQVQDLLDPFHSNENDSQTIGIPFFTFERISASTDGFSEANKLGEGGFGPVYKVRISITYKKNVSAINS